MSVCLLLESTEADGQTNGILLFNVTDRRIVEITKECLSVSQIEGSW